MGADHARKLARVVSGAELVAVTDFDANAAGAVAGELGARLHGDGLELIDDPAVNAVVIATRDDAHADLVLATLRAGKPVMCEKPLAPTADRCREVAAA
jgi:myo-inositol 2-dehydrogenase / D-chiro-inositol 1-dehydrogenase